MTGTTEWRDDDRSTFEEILRTQLQDIYSARPWIVSSEIVQAAADLADQLRLAGADRTLAIGAYQGVGDLPEAIEHIVIGDAYTGFKMEAIRHADQVLRSPPPAVLEAVDRFDPHGSARAIVDFTMSAGTRCGRPTFGARPRQWEELEDKIAVARLWEDAGVRTAPSECLDLDSPRSVITSHHRRLASANGTVWSVDNRAGWHGGAHGTFWVPDEEVAVRVLDRLDPRHRRIRMMPFLDGIPCSIHGMVIGETTIAFRPIESLVYLSRRTARFVYARASSHWDPPQSVRDGMRAVAVAVGRVLRERVGYRGIFTVDGVLTASGFRPTEVNTRYGAALPASMETVDGEPINLFLTNVAVIEGLLDVDPSTLERWVCANLDAHRFCSSFFETTGSPSEERHRQVVFEAGGRLWLSGGDDPDVAVVADVHWAAKGETGMLRITAGSDLPIGPASAPLVLEIARLVDAEWRIGLPELESASGPHSPSSSMT